ncbi:MAG: hypothetical protein GQ582_09705 [Methyloprofundus sp.]|nr:hypothetical protein [Methyloprofundus sp.]
MKNKYTLRLKIVFISSCLAVILNGCSDDKTTSEQAKTPRSWDHAHKTTVTDTQKHQFEHDFAEQCVTREVRQSGNDRKQFAKPCMCIATFMMQDLTAIEAEKFLKENKSTQSLRIRFENSAYHCLQK